MQTLYNYFPVYGAKINGVVLLDSHETVYDSRCGSESSQSKRKEGVEEEESVVRQTKIRVVYRSNESSVTRDSAEYVVLFDEDPVQITPRIASIDSDSVIVHVDDDTIPDPYFLPNEPVSLLTALVNIIRALPEFVRCELLSVLTELQNLNSFIIDLIKNLFTLIQSKIIDLTEIVQYFLSNRR